MFYTLMFITYEDVFNMSRGNLATIGQADPLISFRSEHES